MSMFNMQHHNQPQYAFAQAATPQPRQYATHGTSSAFSSSANPDEDWTKISDLAERRRIQNRIAQRNYRKKLKRRLEDLERRAGSPEEAEAQKPAPAAPTKTPKKATKSQQQQQQQQQRSRESTMVKPMPQMQFTPPMENSDELIFGTFDDRERSNTPPMFSYSTYPAPDDMLMPPYGTSQAYQPTGMVTTADAYPSYLTAPTVPSTLPSMSHFADAAIKRDYSTDPYFTYGFLPGMDMNATYDQTNPQTPPLSHSFDHSANCSESGYEYPTTPMSMPGSPGMIQQQTI